MTDLIKETLSAAEAIRKKIKYFSSVRPCKDCGSHSRWLEKWSASFAYCTYCFPEKYKTESKSQISNSLNSRNNIVKKLLAKPGPLPVVFSGMNNR